MIGRRILPSQTRFVCHGSTARAANSAGVFARRLGKVNFLLVVLLVSCATAQSFGTQDNANDVQAGEAVVEQVGPAKGVGVMSTDDASVESTVKSGKKSASRSVVSMLLSFTFVDNLLKAASRSPEHLSDLSAVDEQLARALSSVPLTQQEADVEDAEAETADSESAQAPADTTTADKMNVKDNEFLTPKLPQAESVPSSVAPADPADNASQQRAVRSIRLMVVALGIIAIVGLVRLLMHFNQIAHGNYAGRLQFIGWVGVTLIVVVSLGVALSEQLWTIPKPGASSIVPAVENSGQPKMDDGTT